LAIAEGSFVAEYRVDPKGFDILHQLLSPILSVNTEMVLQMTLLHIIGMVIMHIL
jgi:hypothetical protein